MAVCAAGCARSPQPRAASETKWALIADTHISSDPEHEVNDSRMSRALASVVRHVLDARPDHVLVNGDVAFRSGEPGDYVQFGESIQPLAASRIPLHLTLGNHDHRAHLVAALSPPCEKSVSDKTISSRVEGGTHWILLDSLEKVNGIPGTLGEPQRAWLARRLDTHPDTPAVICLHHNPEWTLTGLTDAPQFLEVIRPRRQVKAIVFGHTHEFGVTTVDGIHMINLPAVGYRFRADKALGWVLAHVDQNQMEIELRCLNGGESACDSARILPWRTARPS